MLRNMYRYGGLLLLAGAAILATPGSGSAQRGGGHGGGGHVGGARIGGGHFGGAHSGGRVGGFYHGGYRSGFYHRRYGSYPYYNNYLLYGGGYSGEDDYTDDAPFVLENTTTDSGYRGVSSEEYQAYAQPYTAYYPSTPPPADNTVHVSVNVPADAVVWFDRTRMTSTGSAREYQSPALTPGKRYTYEVRARWNDNGHEVTQTQKVAVTAGARVNVTFPSPTEARGTDVAR
jgi:uncharacterized protein (TIGR03000 family)